MVVETRIVCEAGCNFKNLEEAKLFIKKSKELNLFATKFQLYSDEQIKGSKDYEFLKSIMLDYNKAKELYDYGQSIEQNVFFTPMYIEAVDMLEEVGVNYYKIRFKDKDNWNIRVKILETNKPYFISVDEMPLIKHKNELNLFCIPKYPATYQDYDIGIDKLNMFNGISDHSNTLQLLKECLLDFGDSYYFERHMCLDKNCLESAWSSTFEEIKEVLK